ncbi:RNA polymerase sigma factor RpoE [Jeongeupia naejangsanensis]|uniref:RNA polymerase sigma factor n=1 Tax=Jeongeupia naejangsanensis TaxID=613195 RepID=A0ABS2BIU0_9NEIS|nr:RNA polymerase sigma factor RpoE [Jeongeupia naejangsanensis]
MDSPPFGFFNCAKTARRPNTEYALEQRTERELDSELVARAQAGDKRAFELLVIKYQRRIARLLSRLIRDPAEIEDVAQEAFIKAYRALPSFRGESAFYTWLYRIAINTAKNYLASMGRRPQLAMDYEDEEGETLDAAAQIPDFHTPESELSNRQIVSTVNEAVDALPEELRTAITLREMEGLSYEEISSVMNCPIGTVRSRIFRAREAIATKLRPLLATVGKDRRW